MGNGENNFIYLLVSAILIVLVVIASLYFIFDRNKGEEDKKILQSQILRYKCMFSCPNISSLGYQNETYKYFDGSCFMGYCQNEFSGKAYLKEGSKYYERQKNFEAMISKCYNNFRDNDIPEADFRICLKETFDANKDIIDVSNFTLSNYTIYNLSILNLECYENKANITLRIDSGDKEISNLTIIFKEKDGSIQMVSGLPAPEIGAVHNIVVEYPSNINNVSSIGGAIRTKSGIIGEVMKNCN